MSIKKRASNVMVILSLVSALFTIASPVLATTTTTINGLGSETAQTVALVTDGIKNFLFYFAGPYWFIVIMGFFALIIIGIFAMLMKAMGG